MLKSLNFRALLVSALFMTTLFVQSVSAQVQTIDYQIKYNTETCLWDFFIIIVDGNATTVPQRAQFNAQYSFVVPSGTSVGTPIGRNPIQNNQNYTGTLPTEWSYGTPAINPAASPGLDFYPTAPKLAPASFFNNLTEGDTVNIFSVDIGIMPNCAEQIRPFINGSDPGPGEPGMGGGNFSNGYTLGSPTQLYNVNQPTVPPPAPVVEIMNMCINDGIQLDATATTSTCQEPLTFSWSGPNGYTGTDEDVSVVPATAADQGTYTVTVTDAFGCETITSIFGEIKPEAGDPQDGCADSTLDLLGDPATGTWSADPTNPAGASVQSDIGGTATVAFDPTSTGEYTFIYSGMVCADSTVITIVEPDAGPDPSAVGCFNQGTASLSASGTGTWSIGPSSPGIANIADPTSASTTVTGFSVPGTYVLVWDIGACTDEVTIVVNDECDCSISNNSLTAVSPNNFCGSSGMITIDGGAVPVAGTYLWEYSLNAGSFGAAPGANTSEDYTTLDLTAGSHSFRRVYTTSTGVICGDTSNVVSFSVIDFPSDPANMMADPATLCLGESTTIMVDDTFGATYNWSAPAGAGLSGMPTSNFVVLTPTMVGTYTISVTQTVNGCESGVSEIDITVNETPPDPTAGDVTSTDPTACAASDGSISIAGYTAGQSYVLNYQENGTPTTANITADGSGVLVLSGLTAGSYASFSVETLLGCASGVFAGPISLVDPAAPSNPTGLTASPNPECLGLPITLTVDDVPGATFNWSSPSPNAGLGTSSTNTIEMNATAPGLYNIFVSLTLNGCTSIDTFTSIQVNDSPVTPTAGNVVGTNPTACGGADGFITITGYDPSTAYDVTYSANGVETMVAVTTNASGSFSINGLTEGTYTDFSLSNFTGCSSGVFPGPVSLADPGSPDAPANLTAVPNPVCLGTDVTLSVDNSIGATFNWSANSPDAGLAAANSNNVSMSPTVAGTYTISVSVTVAGCTSMSSSVEVVVGDTPTTPTNVVAVNPSACGGSDGQLTISGFAPGEMLTLNYTENATAVSVDLTANAAGEFVITGLSAGTYSDFSTMNSAMCPSGTFAGPVNISDPSAPDAPTDLTAMPNPICQGETVTITATGELGAEFTWSVSPLDSGFNPNNTNTITFTPSADGIFSVTATQTVAGCTSESSAAVSVIVSPSPTSPTAADVSGIDPSVCTGSDGAIQITGQDPSESYGVQLDSAMITITRVVTADPAGVLLIPGLSAGSYTNIILTNQLGCSSVPFAGPVTIADPGSPDAPANLTATPNPSCLGTEVSLSVDMLAGATYSWSTSSADAGLVMSTTNTTTMLATVAGTYTITVNQNLAGCVSPSAMIEVEVLDTPPTLDATTITGTDPTECGVDNGTLFLTGLPTGIQYVLSYTFNGVPDSRSFLLTTISNGEVTLSNYAPGTYADFVLTNPAGCASDVYAGPIVLSAPGAPDAPTNPLADPNPSCFGETIDLSVDPVAGATYTWAASDIAAGLGTSITNTNQLDPLGPGTYTISVSLEVGGCTSDITTFEVTVNPTPITATSTTISFTDPTSCGVDDGTITLAGYSANTDYELVFSITGTMTMTLAVTTNAAGEIVLEGLAAGSYTGFIVTDGSGCSSDPSTEEVLLMEPGAPLAPQMPSAVPNPVCLGGTVQLMVQANAAATFTWEVMPNTGLTPNGNTAVLTPDAAGVYTISVTQTVSDCVSPPTIIEVVALADCINPDFGVTYNGVELTGDLSTNDVALPGSIYGDAQVIGTNPSLAVPTINTDGTYTFNSTAVGEYYFLVDVCAPSGGDCFSKPLAITVLDIESTENPPVANHDYIMVVQGNPTEINILSNDKCQSFPNCILENVSIEEGPFGGSYNTGTGTYTANSTFVGRDSFLYEVCQDPATPETCDQEWVYIYVTPSFASEFTNAMDDYNQTALNTPINATAAEGLLANDNDPMGVSQLVTPSASSVAGKGSIVINTDGSYDFTPELDFVGPVDFEYQVCRGTINTICDMATLHLLVEPQAASGSVASCVWEDTNGNGIFEGGEPGLANVPVRLRDTDGNLIAEMVTDAQGNYQFDDVLAGIYFLEFETIGEYEFTLANIGNDNNDSDVDGTYGEGTTTQFTLGAGEVVSDFKAGLFECTKVGDNVWYDVNLNDVFDDIENGINGLKVFLYRRVDGQWVVWDQTTTSKKPNSPSDDGWYEFCTAPGEYYIYIELPPTGLVQAVPFVGNDPTRDSDINNANGPGTTNSFTLSNGQDNLNFGAGYYPQAIVGNLVWLDEDFNGIQNANEPRIAGVRVQAYDANTQEMISEAYSDENGVYSLDSLDKRDVFFKFTPPSGLVATVPNVVNDQIDSDVDHTFGVNTTRIFSTQPNSTNNHVDFGLAFGALPVKWVDVLVTDVDGAHRLDWIVEQEVNVASYQVMRRHESQDEFTQITDQGIRANDVLSQSEYDYLDNELQLAGLYYYKIKQVDYDGKVNYSKTVVIDRQGDLDTKMYPNPARHSTNISYVATNDGTISVMIHNVEGKLAKSLRLNVAEGSGEIRINTKDLLPGVYNVAIELDGQISNTRLIRIE